MALVLQGINKLNKLIDHVWNTLSAKSGVTSIIIGVLLFNETTEKAFFE
jgi:hypothetical protein